MDSADEFTNDDEIEKRVRTLWVGNLHPKVSSRDIAELFYQVIIIHITNRRLIIHILLDKDLLKHIDR